VSSKRFPSLLLLKEKKMMNPEDVDHIKKREDFTRDLLRKGEESAKAKLLADKTPEVDNSPKEYTFAQKFRVYPNGTMYPVGNMFPIGAARKFVKGKSSKKKGKKTVAKLDTAENY